MTRRTKIVATLGPASDDPSTLATVLRAGADVIRINLSHGTLEGHLAAIAMVRSISAELDRPVGILADLPGPKIRAGTFPEHGAILASGNTVTLVSGAGPSGADRITVGYDELLEDVDPGDRVIIGDGAISMRVTAATKTELVARVETGGRAQGRPGVHLSCGRLQMRAPTTQDLDLAEAAVSAGADYVALSFVRRADDVHELRRVVRDRAGIVAKIETSAALAELPAIADAADALMVARGDLGIDCPLEDVPHLQKRIVRHCVEIGRPVITATQMLESMINSPSPTRAEVSDVANAVFDGTDAVMLSGETAIGRDPGGVVATMGRIAARAEAEASYRQWAERLGRVQRTWSDMSADRITTATTHAAWQAAIGAEATAILCCTRTGRTARAMARFRPSCRLVGLSPDPHTVNALTLSWGVESLQVEEYRTTDEMVWFAVETAVQHRLVSHDDIVLVLAGAPDRHSGAAADVLRIVRVS